MTDQNKQEPKKTATPKDRFEAEFAALPLEEKFAKLFRMEAATFTEAFNYAVKEPMKVVEKVGDAISDLGVRIENEVKKAAKQHGACDEPVAPKRPAAAKPKARSARKPSPPRSAKP